MSRITQYAAHTYPALSKSDLLIAVDISDTSMASTGTDKKLSFGDLRGPFRYLTDYGADPTFTNDSTSAVNSWIADLNASGGTGYIPYGQYKVASALTAITANGVTIIGDGYAQTSPTSGSVLSATATIASQLFQVTGEGVQIAGVTLDGANHAATVLAISGPQAHLRAMQARSCSSAGVCVDVQSGGNTFWADDCIFNGINGANTALQINDTDAIIIGCKPKNCAYGVVLLGGASGALIEGCHWTPGSGVGVNGVWINGSPGRLAIVGNRFDNYVTSALQISPGGSIANSVIIANNVFYSTVQTDNTWATIGYDTTSGNGVYGLQIIGNTVYSNGTNRNQYFLDAQTAAGGTASNQTNIATYGTMVNSNAMYVATGAFGPSSSPLVARGNTITTNGTAWSALTDI